MNDKGLLEHLYNSSCATGEKYAQVVGTNLDAIEATLKIALRYISELRDITTEVEDAFSDFKK